jgi:hypothetical protein
MRSTVKSENMPMIVRNLHLVKLDRYGYSTSDDWVDYKGNKGRKHYPLLRDASGRALGVFEFDLYFAKSYRKYSTEYVRARDNRYAKKLIREKYPHVIEFRWS